MKTCAKAPASTVKSTSPTGAPTSSSWRLFWNWTAGPKSNALSVAEQAEAEAAPSSGASNGSGVAFAAQAEDRHRADAEIVRARIFGDDLGAAADA